MNEELSKSARIWAKITSTRIFISNVFFLLILSIIVIGLMSAIFSSDLKDPANKAFFFQPNGPIVEQIENSSDPLSNLILGNESTQISLKETLRIFSKLKNDNRIQYIILNLDNIEGTGQTALFDIGQSLKKLKDSGKKIIAIGDSYSQSAYYLASFANEIILNPDGGILIEGYSRYRNYYKSFLDKVGVTINLFKVGTHKSAVEPLTRDDMSIEDRNSSKIWMNDLWDSWKENVASNRQLIPQDIQYFADNLNILIKDADGDFGKTVLNAKLVDKLLNRTETREYLLNKIGPDDTEKTNYARISIDEYLQVVNAEEPSSNIPNNIAVIVAQGTIMDGDYPPGTIGGDSTAQLIRNARQNDEVKAIVLRVDSGGGSAFASEVIREEIIAAKQQNIPVVASMSNVAASGGYWISASANEIWASHDTITGSIGIFGFIPTFEDSLDAIGIHSDGLGTTNMSGNNITREINPVFAEILQSNIEHGYLKFISLVARERNMTLEEVDLIAQGRVWSGKEALKIGLIDKLGNLSSAIDRAANLANLNEYKTFFPENTLDWKEEFIASLFGKVFIGILSLLNLEAIISTSENLIISLDKFKDPKNIYAICEDCLTY